MADELEWKWCVGEMRDEVMMLMDADSAGRGLIG